MDYCRERGHCNISIQRKYQRCRFPTENSTFNHVNYYIWLSIIVSDQGESVHN